MFQLDISSFPILVTLIKIGDQFVVDGTAEEEACGTAKLAVAVNSSGNICCVEQTGQSGVPPSALMGMIQQAAATGKQLLGTLDSALKSSQVPSTGSSSFLS